MTYDNYKLQTPPQFTDENKSDEWVRLNDIWNQWNVLKHDYLYSDNLVKYFAVIRLMRIIEFKMKSA